MEVIDKRRLDESGAAKRPVYRHSLAGVVPAFDRVLIKVLPKETDSLIATPDAYQEPSQYAKVLAVGQGLVIGGIRAPIPFAVGDVVRYSLVSFETLPNEFSDTDPSDLLGFIRAQDVRCYWKADDR